MDPKEQIKRILEMSMHKNLIIVDIGSENSDHVIRGQEFVINDILNWFELYKEKNK